MLDLSSREGTGISAHAKKCNRKSCWAMRQVRKSRSLWPIRQRTHPEGHHQDDKIIDNIIPPKSMAKFGKGGQLGHYRIKTGGLPKKNITLKYPASQGKKGIGEVEKGKTINLPIRSGAEFP